MKRRTQNPVHMLKAMAYLLVLLPLAGCPPVTTTPTAPEADDDLSAPAAPSGLSATPQSSNGIRLAWTDNSADETGFKIERSANGSSGWTEVKETAANAVSGDDTGLSASTTYYYRVKAFNTGGDSAYSNTAHATTASAGPATPAAPIAPGGLSAVNLSHSEIRLTWTDNSTDETGFKIERSPDGSSGWAEVKQTTADAKSWDDSGLSANTRYSYRVKAAGAASDSAYSNTASTFTAFTPLIVIDAAGDTFLMGDGSYGPNPAVKQTISYGFKMSKYEITNAQFAEFIADNGYSKQSFWTTNGWTQKTSGDWTQPGYWTDAKFNGSSQPVVGVSWYEAVAFCNWRSVKEGLAPAYDGNGKVKLSASGYRLPAEVEWEYAAAKGASGQAERIYAWGSTWDASRVVCEYTWTEAVGSKSPKGDTPQGLADMSGNVWEWVTDNYQADGSVASGTDRYYFLDDSITTRFLFRGGSWGCWDEYDFRCAYRFGQNILANKRNNEVGFRVVRR